MAVFMLLCLTPALQRDIETRATVTQGGVSDIRSIATWCRLNIDKFMRHRHAPNSCRRLVLQSTAQGGGTKSCFACQLALFAGPIPSACDKSSPGPLSPVYASGAPLRHGSLSIHAPRTVHFIIAPPPLHVCFRYCSTVRATRWLRDNCL